MSKKKSGFISVVFLGLVSFFSDISTEMVYPLIPLYLTATLGATPVLIGIIEGIAESIASLLKVFSGYIADKYHKKKQLAFLGYVMGIIYKLLLIISSSWVGILIARVSDKIGKGIRTAPRDVLVAENSKKENLGKSFGLHKALDMAGSALGIFISFIILKNLSNGIDNYKLLFWISIIPAIIGLTFLSQVYEQDSHQKQFKNFTRDFKNIDQNLRLYLLITFVFTLGNSSNAFMLLRAKDLGFSDTNVILLYFIYNLVAALLSIPFGKLSDKIGRKKVLIAAYLMFSLVYLLLGVANSNAFMILAFMLYGLYSAIATGAERAMIYEIAPQKLKGTMLGLHATLVGIALLPASIIAGLLWNNFGASAPFIFGSSLSLIAAIVLLLLFNRMGKIET